MIKKYWSTLEWLVNHKMRYLAAFIYAITFLFTFPLLVVLSGLVNIVEQGYVDVFKSTLKGFWKGNE